MQEVHGDPKPNNDQPTDQSAVIISLMQQKQIDTENQLFSAKKTVKYLSCGVFVLALSAIFVVVRLKDFPMVKVVNTVDNSVICPIEASKNPRVTDAVITDFAKQAILSVYNLNFINWREIITNAGNVYFTEKGKDELMRQLARSSAISRVVQGNLIMKTTADMPQLEERNLLAKEPNWIVTVPITTQFYTSSQSQPAETHKFIARIKVVEHPRSAQNYNGVAISVVGLTPVR